MMKTMKKPKTVSTPDSTAKNDSLRTSMPKAEARKSTPAKTNENHTPELKAISKPNSPAAPMKTAALTAAERKTNHVLLELVKPGAKSVCVAGSFNQWTPETTPLVPKGNDRWVGDLTVKPGRHEYLFVVDGQWVPDPNAKESVANPFGGMNSVLIVKE